MGYAVLAIWCIWWACWLAVGFTSKRTVSREPFAARAWHLIPLVCGCTLIIGSRLLPELHIALPRFVRLLGVINVAIGLGFACWARLHLGRNWSGLIALKEGHELVRSGPYKFLRHPIYTGLVFAAFASALAMSNPAAIVGACMCGLAAIIKLDNEEEFLTRAFGSNYTRLCQDVPDRLIPGVF